MDAKKSYVVETWGCQMNVYDSQRFAAQLEALGYVPATSADGAGDAGDADLVLLNTCSVREKAAHKMFSRLGRLRQLKKAKPELLVGVGGCVAQQEQERILKREPAVDFVVGTRAVGRLPELVASAAAGNRAVDVAMEPRYDDIRPVAPGKSRRAYITAVEGCDKACSFCIVPTTRGKEVNRSPETLVAEAAAAIAAGAVEVELLGQNVNAYRHGDVDFAGLLRMVGRLEGLHRLRFTTSHPRELTDPVIAAMAATDAVCEHLHLPVQSGSDAVLKRMYRGYDRARYLDRVERLRRRIPDVALSTDIIVGFPGETEAEFDDTMRLLDEARFDQVFAFVYSPRPFTAAAAFPDGVAEERKQARLQRLFRRQDELAREKSQALLGRTFEVLLDDQPTPLRMSGDDATEPARGQLLSGRTRCNRIVHVPPPNDPGPVLVQARIVRALPHSLVGELVAA